MMSCAIKRIFSADDSLMYYSCINSAFLLSYHVRLFQRNGNFPLLRDVFMMWKRWKCYWLCYDENVSWFDACHTLRCNNMYTEGYV